MRLLLLSVLASAPAAAVEAPAQPVRFECAVALMTPQRELTNTAPVVISFTQAAGDLQDIQVVDSGGIFYPGANMRVVNRADVISIEAVPVPAERPGEWNGKAENKMYRLALKSGTLADAVTISIGRKPAKETGRYGLIWSATNQPEGMPEPLSGTGIGNCAIVKARDSQ